MFRIFDIHVCINKEYVYVFVALKIYFNPIVQRIMTGRPWSIHEKNSRNIIFKSFHLKCQRQTRSEKKKIVLCSKDQKLYNGLWYVRVLTKNKVKMFICFNSPCIIIIFYGSVINKAWSWGELDILYFITYFQQLIMTWYAI